MRARSLLLAVVMVVPVLAGCIFDGGPDTAPNPVETCGQLDGSFAVDPAYNPRVHFETSNGSVTVAVYLEQVPFSAGNFLSLAGDGFFDGTRFHQLRPGVFIQGGDPKSASDERRVWGTGGPGYRVPDEFHQFLRHDEPGVLSMAQAKPNNAGSQFIITLRALPSLDDHSSIFGEVVSGMQTVREISRTPTDDQNRPLFHAKVENATLLAPNKNPDNASARLTSYGYDCEQAAEPGDRAEFLLAVRNTGQRLANGTFDHTADELPGDWSVGLRAADTVPLPSGQTNVFLVDAQVPEDAAPGAYRFNVTFGDKASTETTTRTLTVNVGPLGAQPSEGDTVTLRYVGILEDGRPFDTTMREIATSESLTWFKAPPEHLQPVQTTVGQSGLIEGMSTLMQRAKLGQSVTGEVGPDEGYGANAWGPTDLGGRVLYFQIDVLDPAQVPGTDVTKRVQPSSGSVS